MHKDCRQSVLGLSVYFRDFQNFLTFGTKKNPENLENTESQSALLSVHFRLFIHFWLKNPKSPKSFDSKGPKVTQEKKIENYLFFYWFFNRPISQIFFSIGGDKLIGRQQFRFSLTKEHFFDF